MKINGDGVTVRHGAVGQGLGWRQLGETIAIGLIRGEGGSRVDQEKGE